MRFGGSVFRNGPTRPEEIAYGVVAGAVWLGWILVVVFVSVKVKKAEVSRSEQVSETGKGREV